VPWTSFQRIVQRYGGNAGVRRLIPFHVKNMNNIAMKFVEDCHGQTSQRCRAH